MNHEGGIISEVMMSDEVDRLVEKLSKGENISFSIFY